jgi:hypothetical protein
MLSGRVVKLFGGRTGCGYGLRRFGFQSADEAETYSEIGRLMLLALEKNGSRLGRMLA